MSLRDDLFDFKKNVSWRGSIILYLLEIFAYMLQFISITAWYGQVTFWFGRRKPYPRNATELFLIIIFITQLTFLIFWNKTTISQHEIFLFITIYFLFDNLSAILRDIITAPNRHSGFIKVHNRQRWLLLTLFTMIEVILSFSVIILYFGGMFKPEINDPINALYVSTVTFLTLGYGDFVPVEPASKIVILSELLFFLFYLALKLPLAVGMFRVEDYFKQNDSQ